jgi:hypothetical protein
VLFAFLLVSCGAEPELEKINLPELSSETIELRVASVINPRFKKLSDKQLKKILKKTVSMVKQNFDISIAFTEPEIVSIEGFFTYLKENIKTARSKDIVDSANVSQIDREKMQDGVYDLLDNYQNDQEAIVEYARPYLLVPYEGDDFDELAKALVDTLLIRLEYWRNQKAADGKSVINKQPYNEWVWWDSIGYSDMPFDVVITNQLVASAEIQDMSVHSSIRGGITAGTTAYSKKAQFNGYVYAMTYPMLNDSEILTTLRNDKHYTSDQITTYAAALLTHELGHLLLHLGHPFGNPSCVMSPTPLLKYREWVEGLDASKCLLNSEEAMTPGRISIVYRADW